jgi:nucleoside-diphosphate-sugar epimerase
MGIGIIGHTGFIGHHLKNALSENLILISTREIDWKKKINRSNVIINLVGKAHDHNGKAKLEDYHYANVILVQDIFKEFLNSTATLFIHISSLAAVEEYESKKYLVENDCCNPKSYYGITKRDAEVWLLQQKLPENKKVIIIRPPMVHGPGDKGNLGLLYKLISKGIPYPLSSFKNKRSFISIYNFTFFIKEIISKQELLESGIYHISDDDPISTNEIIEIIKKITKKNMPNLALPKFLLIGLARIGDIVPIPLNSVRLKKLTSILLVSNSKIKSALGIQKLPLSAEEGLKITIKSFIKS